MGTVVVKCSGWFVVLFHVYECTCKIMSFYIK